LTETTLTLLTALAPLVLTFGAAATPGAAQEASASRQDTPNWIWFGAAESDQEILFRRTFELPGRPARAVLSGSCDNHMIVLLNGQRVGVHGSWEEVVSRDITSFLSDGVNTLEVRARNDGGPAGLALRMVLGDGRVLVTDGAWEAALPQRARRGLWEAADVLGPVGAAGLPWSARITPASFLGVLAEFGAEEPGQTQPPRVAEGLNLLDGFAAELLYTVPNELQGSWVALTTDDRGRLYASDQGDRGIYRIVPAAVGDPAAVTVVERVPVDVSGAQGMCWAFNSLYVNVNGQGVWRLTDSDGDDTLDAAVNIIPLGNGGEHGPHALLPTEDGQGLYFIAGNHTPAPRFDGSRAPANWGEDLLLPRLWDANGHARGLLAPGGWIARCDPDGKNIQIISSGYRNQFDIALNAEREMFTFDADMEWDIGSPWYRPTRVCHVTSGSEFGWRSGTGKWPAFYEDSLPPVLDIGPGSPTGIVFGAGARFPARYQQALFLLDWTFGTIYALHLEPKGATYTATKEDFVWAKPLGVTDAVIGADGALYFTVGGRGSRSALYRVRYTGAESTAPVTPVVRDAGTEARAERRVFEAFHGHADPRAVDAVWPGLSSPDRFIRFAARIALENQPVGTWRARALSEEEPQAAVLALIALARQGAPSDLPALIAALDRLELASLEEPQLLAALRAYALAFTRLGEPDDALRGRVSARLDRLFPAGSAAVDMELARILVYLRAPSVVEKTMALVRAAGPEELPGWAELVRRNDSYGGPIAKMLADMPPISGIGFAFLLSNATEGWTPALRREYFEFFVSASKHPGGNSYAGFLDNIRRAAAATLTVAEERSLAPLLGESLLMPPPADVTPPVGPGRQWTTTAAMEVVGAELTDRSFAAGRNLYHATSCSTCHRFDGEGGAIGPDLTTVANKFSVADILEAVLEPSKVISDQYGSHTVVDLDGRIFEGLLVEDDVEVTIYPRDVAAEPVTIPRAEIKALQPSKLSQMPNGLVDGLNPEELRDLLAFLVSGGDRKSAVFEPAPAGGKR